MTKRGGVFCLETSWADDGKDMTYPASVVQTLRMLESAAECGKVIHRDVATQEEFVNYMKEWRKKKYDAYPLAYLAFHGVRGGLGIGDIDLTFDDLTAIIGPGKARDRILYFGSCSTMAVDEDKLKTFCAETGATAIVGYTRRIGWLESAAFDCLLVPKLLGATFMKPVFTGLKKDYPDFVDRLGLRIATSRFATPRKIAADAASASSLA
jgi:hypothetical protein